VLFRGFTVRCTALRVILLALSTIHGVALAAQDIAAPHDTSANFQFTGMVRSAGGAGIPGTTLRVIQTSSGNAWVSWTDETGKFEFPALPDGHFRVEISQLGFAPATKEIDLGIAAQPSFEIKLDVGTLAAISAPAATVISAPSNAPAKSNPAADAAANHRPDDAARPGAHRPRRHAGAGTRGAHRQAASLVGVAIQ